MEGRKREKLWLGKRVPSRGAEKYWDEKFLCNPGPQMRVWSSWERIQGRIETKSFLWDMVDLEEFCHHGDF